MIRFPLRRASNLSWHKFTVDKAARSAIKGHRPAVLWFTGLSGSGKSTIADGVEKRLLALGRHTYTLDGDNVRHGLSRDLGFTDADRVENIRRVIETARLMADAGLIVLVSFISPFRAERRLARERLEADDFMEIFVDTPLAECERRDPKGLYRKAREGKLKNFTGINSAYEAAAGPRHPYPDRRDDGRARGRHRHRCPARARHRRLRAKRPRTGLSGALIHDIACDRAAEGLEAPAEAMAGLLLGHGRTREPHRNAAQHAVLLENRHGHAMQSRRSRRNGEGVSRDADALELGAERRTLAARPHRAG